MLYSRGVYARAAFSRAAAFGGVAAWRARPPALAAYVHAAAADVAAAACSGAAAAAAVLLADARTGEPLERYVLRFAPAGGTNACTPTTDANLNRDAGAGSAAGAGVDADFAEAARGFIARLQHACAAMPRRARGVEVCWEVALYAPAAHVPPAHVWAAADGVPLAPAAPRVRAVRSYAPAMGGLCLQVR